MYTAFHDIQYMGFVISYVTNPLLISLLCSKSKYLMGRYSVLMLIFSCFSMFYSLIEVLTLPTMHITGSGLIIFLDSEIANIRMIGILVVTMYCGCFTMCLGLLTNQFLYRYMMVCRNEKLHWFSYYRCLLTYSHCFVSTVLWMLFVAIYLTPTAQWEEMFKEELKHDYNVDISMLAFVSTVYYTYDSSGGRVYNKPIFIGCGLLSFYMCFCISLIFFCVVRSFSRLNGSLQTISQNSKVLNRQIIKSLIIQTCLPMITMYLPVGLLLIFPFFEFKVGSIINFVGISMSIYPAIDPLIAIFLVNEFRARLTVKITPSPVLPRSATNSVNLQLY